MRTILAAVLSVVVILGLAAPPAFAQPPAPKVTINGLVDFATAYQRNLRDNNITNTQDEGWYSRERGVFTFTGEIGKAKGVIAFEFDFTNGAGPTSSGTTANFDLDTDVPGTTEVKWLYVEAPLTGPGSLLPFLPMESQIRLGAQPATGHAYKPGILWSGDFPGVNITTTWAPNMRSTLTFAQIGEQVDSLAGGNEDIAFLASFEFDVFKGLTIKPTYTYANYDAFNTGTANLGTESPKGGFTPNVLGAHLSRHTIGADVRWRSGPFSLEPTFIYQIGTQECTILSCGHTNDVDINAWIFDVTGGFRTGPLTIEGRFAYTPGMKAEDCVQAGGFCGTGGEDIKYYQAINPGFVYQAGWAEIQASGVDYNLVHFGAGGAAGVRLGQSPSYDKYGRITLAAAVDYAVTPAFVLHLVGNAQWTAEKVDTGRPALSGAPTSSGDENYLGTEIDVGLTYRFAPNVAFDLIGGYLIAGDARGFNNLEPEDITKVAARMRVTW
ncbi:MAG TPA: hypothetical protein VLG10_13990 [Methylomirabilota bacterium]|nr:hypothetical protein [Methylomirabilota bacterium]